MFGKPPSWSEAKLREFLAFGGTSTKLNKPSTGANWRIVLWTWAAMTCRICCETPQKFLVAEGDEAEDLLTRLPPSRHRPRPQPSWCACSQREEEWCSETDGLAVVTVPTTQRKLGVTKRKKAVMEHRETKKLHLLLLWQKERLMEKRKAT